MSLFIEEATQASDSEKTRNVGSIGRGYQYRKFFEGDDLLVDGSSFSDLESPSKRGYGKDGTFDTLLTDCENRLRAQPDIELQSVAVQIKWFFSFLNLFILRLNFELPGTAKLVATAMLVGAYTLLLVTCVVSKDMDLAVVLVAAGIFFNVAAAHTLSLCNSKDFIFLLLNWKLIALHKDVRKPNNVDQGKFNVHPFYILPENRLHFFITTILPLCCVISAVFAKIILSFISSERGFVHILTMTVGLVGVTIHHTCSFLVLVTIARLEVMRIKTYMRNYMYNPKIDYYKRALMMVSSNMVIEVLEQLIFVLFFFIAAFLFQTSVKMKNPHVYITTAYIFAITTLLCKPGDVLEKYMSSKVLCPLHNQHSFTIKDIILIKEVHSSMCLTIANFPINTSNVIVLFTVVTVVERTVAVHLFLP